MKTAKIRFSTSMLSRLGEELNPNPDQGILELVKNAYDADAMKCIIELKNVDKSGGSILVSDDGDGMDEEDIANGWLLLGESNKVTTKRTRLGRIPAGNKGLGRLAALRMGSGAALSSRPIDSNWQYDLYIDWRLYESAKTVDQVDLRIDQIVRSSNQSKGTDVLIENLRHPVSRMAVKRLARALILLADPFGDDPEGFNPRLIAPEFIDLEKLVQGRYFEEAEYHLHATVDENGCLTANVYDFKKSPIYQAEHGELTKHRKESPYKCPAATFDLWVFLLDSEKFVTRKVSITEVRIWLQEFGGVHLYENGLRVSPYGNPGNDWLDMNLRRARHPEFRPSTNTVIGRVSVQNLEGALTQKTDRSGFIEEEQFHELRSFAQDALDWMGARRLETAERRRQSQREKTKSESQEATENLNKAVKNAPKGLKKTFQQYQKTVENRIDTLQKEVQLYRTLSTAGITTATFAHESSGNPIKVISTSINTVERRLQKALDGAYTEKLKKPIDRIKRSIDSLSVLGSATLKLLEYDKRREGNVPIHKVVNNVLDTFKPFLDGRDVDVSTELCFGNPYLIASEAAIESIITNLLNNSLAAFERTDSANSHLKRRIHIHTDIVEQTLTLKVMDNGPGIRDINLKDIWLPGKTTHPNGTGLGLTIVRDTVTDLGGTVSAEAQGPLGGAVIIIELPIIGA